MLLILYALVGVYVMLTEAPGQGVTIIAIGVAFGVALCGLGSAVMYLWHIARALYPAETTEADGQSERQV